MHLFNHYIPDHVVYIPVNIYKVVYQKSILNFLTFNILSILLINNIPDIPDYIYKRYFYSVALHIGGKGAYGVCMPYVFFLHKKKRRFSGISGIYPLQVAENQLFTPIYQIQKWYIVKKSGIS